MKDYMVHRRNFFPDHQQHNLLPSHQGTGSSSPQYCTWPNWSSVIDQYWLSLTSDQSHCFHCLRRIDLKKKITSLPHRACRRNHPRRWTKATCQEPEKGFKICFFSSHTCNYLLHLLHIFKMLCHQVLVQEPILRGGPKAHWREEGGKIDKNMIEKLSRVS